MTLSRFFITYVYIPLGGSKKGKARTIFNTMAIFALSGLWHGANWTYVAWGVMQGLLVVWDNLGIIGIRGTTEKNPARFYIPRWLGWFFTFSFFNLSMFFFRSESMAYAFQMVKNLFSFRNTGYIYKLAANMDVSARHTQCGLHRFAVINAGCQRLYFNPEKCPANGGVYRLRLQVLLVYYYYIYLVNVFLFTGHYFYIF